MMAEFVMTAVWLVAGAGAILQYRARRNLEAKRRRLVRMQLAQEDSFAVSIPPAMPTWRSLLQKFGRLGMLPRNRALWQDRMRQAGQGQSPEEFWGWVALAALGLAVGSAAGAWALGVSPPKAGLLGVGAGLAILLGMPLRLRLLGSRRREMVRQIVPDLYDFLGVSLEAGLTLEAALKILAPQLQGPSREEFQRLLQDLEVGMTRREAFEAMMRRTGMDEFKWLATLIGQRETVGGGLSKTLFEEASRLREVRLARAREKAASLPVRMTLPLVFLLFPVLYIILLGPALIQILH